ncbi:MAG TPA: Do family serine endopeptidase [Beijerinckiaceae bacterium]|nr:Do family serine endopeptidase [Beijerinckiaceae bacterium]
MAFPENETSTPNRGERLQKSVLRMRAAPRGVRVALLGAVAVGLLGGAAVNYTFLPHLALAQTQATQDSQGPASFAGIVDRVRGAVVSVKVKMVEGADASAGDNNNQQQMPGMPQLRPGDPLERFFRQFGENRRPQPRTGIALGSGFIISADGYVVTNNHVVQNASDVTVTMDDGKSLPAKVVGTDSKTDLALLKLQGDGTYPYVEFAAQPPRVGDWVLAVGNPFGLGGTVTAGIVSARGRDIGAGPYDDFIQIDAPVNRGNSGGPTFNGQGQVVGVNTAIYSPSGGSVGIGFDIPADTVKSVINDLKTKGSVARGWIGVQIQPVTQDIADSLGLKSTDGALVADIQDNSPARAAGLKSGDVITAVNNEQVKGPRELARTIASLGPDKKVDIAYVEDGAQKTASVTLGSLPADQQQASAEDSSRGDNGTSLSSFGLTLAPAASVDGAGRNGVVITDIDPDGAAAEKGLRQGDVILEAAGHPVARPADVSKALSEAKKAGRKAVLLRVKSGDNTHFVALGTSAS